MFITILTSIFLLSFFILLGFGISFRCIGRSNYLIPLSAFLGFAMSLYASWLHAQFLLLFFYPICLAFLLSGVYSLHVLAKNDFRLWSRSNSRIWFNSFLPGYLILLISQFTSFSRQGIRLRTGPDLLGWIISSDYFAKNNNLSTLTNSLVDQLGGSTQEILFSMSNSGSVYSIPSYSEQVQAEFIFGSRRIGLTSFVGYVSRISTYLDSQTVLISLMSIFAGLTSFVIISYAKNLGLKRKYILVLLFSTIASTSVLAPIYEGGVWHIFVIPILIYLLIETTARFNSVYNTKAHILISGILISLMLTLTSDLLIVAIPFFTTIGFQYLRYRKFNKLLQFIPLLLILSPGFTIITSALNSRKSDAFVGGWSAVGFGLPGDFIGLTPWQTSKGVFTGEVLAVDYKLLLGALATLFLIYLYSKVAADMRRTFAPYFVVLIMLNAYFYFEIFGAEKINYYIIWKLSFLWSIAFMFLLASYLSQQSAKSTQKMIVGGRNVKPVKKKVMGSRNTVASYLLFVSITNLAIFQANWFQFSRNDLVPSNIRLDSQSGKEIKQILETYDIVGACTPWVTTLAIHGDFHFISDRRAGTNVVSSSPQRERMVVLSQNEPVCASFLSFYPKATKVLQIQSLTFYSID